MSEEKQKWGTEHARAMLRQGLAELRGVFYADSNVAQPTEYGMFGTKTPGEVQRDLHSEAASPIEELRSVLDDRMGEAGREQPEPERDGREPDRD